MGGHSNRKVVDCTQQELLMFHCSVWLRIVLMVQLIVCTVWELNKERHLTAELMKAKKATVCSLWVFSVGICASNFPWPHLTCVCVPRGTHSLAPCGMKTAAAPTWPKAQSTVLILRDWKLEWMWQVLVYYLPWNCDTGQQQAKAELPEIACIRGGDLHWLRQTGKPNLYRHACPMPMCEQKHKRT